MTVFRGDPLEDLRRRQADLEQQWAEARLRREVSVALRWIVGIALVAGGLLLLAWRQGWAQDKVPAEAIRVTVTTGFCRPESDTPIRVEAAAPDAAFWRRLVESLGGQPGFREDDVFYAPYVCGVSKP